MRDATSAESGGLYRVVLLPSDRGSAQLIHAHLEAHDHLATANDRSDGTIEVSGPWALRDEIADAVGEIARALRVLRAT